MQLWICKDLLWCDIPQCIVSKEIKVQPCWYDDEDQWWSPQNALSLIYFPLTQWIIVFSFFFLQVSTYYIISVLCLGVFTGVHLLFSDTCLTLHMAAPAYLAVAGQASEAHGSVITTPAAQTLTTGVFGTWATACTRRVSRGPAEAGGVLQVDQVSSTQALAVASGPSQFCLPSGCVSDTQHSDCGVITELKQPPGIVKWRQLFPASPYSTRTRDAVTLAGCFQTALHCLWWEKRKHERENGRCQFSQFDSLPGLLSGRSICTELASFLRGG